jgi:predicted Zn-dependent protease
VKAHTAVAYFILCAIALPITAAAVKPASNPVLQALREELQRAMEVLQKQSDPPYFTSYQATDLSVTNMEANLGTLRSSVTNRGRYLDIEVRIGDYNFDNTHQLRGSRGTGSAPGYSDPVTMPIEDDIDALKSVIWLETDRRYRAAVERWMQVKANRAVKVQEEDASADFSREPVRTSTLPLASVRVNSGDWENKIRGYSALFVQHPEILEGTASFSATATNKYIVNSEGTSIQYGTMRYRLGIYARTKAEDGMDLYRFESFDSHTAPGMPGDDTVRDAVERIVRDLNALRSAPVIEPYTGPAILSGRAAGVFFHEIFGHRIEGQRQRSEDEGQTFSRQVNKPVLPDFISVFDDPTSRQAVGVDLNGHYPFDDEGVAAQSVPIVENGILKNFLMSRLPLPGFPQSNGHGRKAAGYRPAGRQGNLIIKPSKSVTNAALRQMLIEEVKIQGKSYGLLFDDISGGFTTTGRSSPQAFQVTPIMVYRIYADGRPDELVRGVDLIGTPLTSFSKIAAAGDRLEVFNGFCGAESGSVPVAAVSPAILTTQIEVQKKPKSAERLPILPPPPAIPEGVQP